jgi:ribosome biogenesis protein MAK21
MAKHRATSVTNVKAPKAKSQASRLPTFDEQALSQLTDKIEEGLNIPEADSQRKASSQDNKGNATITTAKSKKTKDPSHASTNGKKRDAQGNIKDSTTISNNLQAAEREEGNDRELLLQEILALGGTEADLDLVGDVLSDDEDEDEGNEPNKLDNDSKFKKELSKLVAGLGIEVESGKISTELEPDMLEAEDWEDDDGEVTVQSLEEVVKTSASKVAQKKFEKDGKDTNRLVSMSVLKRVKNFLLT